MHIIIFIYYHLFCKYCFYYCMTHKNVFDCFSLEKYQEICEEQKEWWTMRVKQINAWLEHKPKKT